MRLRSVSVQYAEDELRTEKRNMCSLCRVDEDLAQDYGVAYFLQHDPEGNEHQR